MEFVETQRFLQSSQNQPNPSPGLHDSSELLCIIKCYFSFCLGLIVVAGFVVVLGGVCYLLIGIDSSLNTEQQQYSYTANGAAGIIIGLLIILPSVIIYNRWVLRLRNWHSSSFYFIFGIIAVIIIVLGFHCLIKAFVRAYGRGYDLQTKDKINNIAAAISLAVLVIGLIMFRAILEKYQREAEERIKPVGNI